MEQFKTCTRCHEAKLVHEFNRDKTRSDGRFPQCKACCKKYAARYYQKNSETVKAKVSAYKLANSDAVATRRADWLEKNRDKNREYQREWMRKHRAANPLKQRNWPKNPEHLRQWRAANPDKVILQKQRRRIRELGVRAFDIKPKEIARILNSPCVYCGSNANIQVDHVVPLSKGGHHSIGNLAPACKTCNVRKSAKFVTQWKLHEKKFQAKAVHKL